MAHGIAWMSAARLAVRGLGLINTFVLARLLGPHDFGLLAMATAVIALGEVLRSFSFDSALIHEQKAQAVDYNTAWTLNVMLGVGVGLLLMLGAPLAARFYGDPRITGVLLVLAAGFAAEGLSNTGTVDFRKNMDFRRDFILMVAQKVVGIAVALSLAFWLRSYWALVFGTLVSSLTGVVMSYVMHPFRPRFSLAARHKLVGFSQWMLISNFTGFLKNKTADMMLGRLSGPQAAGLFSVAFDVANLATTELVAPINRAVLPGYVKLAADPTALRAGFARVLGFIALCACPAALGLAALSEEVVALVLGPKWGEAGGLIRILAVAAALNALLTNSVAVYLAIGRPKLIALMSGVHTASLVPLLIVGTMVAGATGAAWAHLAQVALCAAPVTFYFLVRFTPVMARDIAGSIWRPLVSATAMFFAVRWGMGVLHPADASAMLAGVVACTAGGAVFYISLVLLLWRVAGGPPGAEQIALEFLRAKLGKRVPPVPAG